MNGSANDRANDSGNRTTAATYRRPDHWVPKVAVVLAVVGSTAIGWLLFGGSDPTTQAVPATSIDSLVPSVTDSVDTTAAVTVLETTTVAPAIAPPVETTLPAPPPPEPAAPSVAAIPAIPEPQVFSGFGSHQVMSDPLPSGLAVSQVAPAYELAKTLADWIAAGDWASARTVLPNDPMDDGGFDFRYGPVDKMSLMLINAVPDGGGFILALGVVTNDVAAQQTSVRCFHWYADSVAVDIQDEAMLDQYDQLFGAEAFRNNPELVAGLQARCG